MFQGEKLDRTMGMSNTELKKLAVSIRNNLRPGDIGYLIYLHGVLYAKEYQFDATFEPYVAGPLAEFSKLHTDRERIWIVEKAGQVAGSVAIVGAPENAAQLRWLILHPDVRGIGLGRRLVQEAVDFCKKCEYDRVFLWTVKGLTAATRIYTVLGFQLTEENTHPIWGNTITEQRFELELPSK
ncbi:MAG: GNAT family N-acetyltransferase [Thermodesulfobacteriota bacterium]